MSPRLQAIEAYERLLDKAITQGIEHEVERELCKTDLFYLLTVVLGRKDLNHDWLFDRCREVQAEPNGYLDLWAREHYKSTIITFAKTIQDVLVDPEITVGLFSYNRPTAKKALFQIKQELETNDRLKALFPDVLWENPRKEAPVWSLDEGIIVKRKGNPKEATVEAHGLVEAQPTGRHFKLVVYDDVVTLDTISEGMIEKVNTSWEASINLGADGGHVRYIGTRYHYNDTYRLILDRGSAIPRKHTVTLEGTVDGTPVLRSKEWVANRRRDLGPYMFASQMLLDPVADRNQGFLEKWLRYYPNSRIGDFEGMNKYILVDAANTKKKKSDFTAIAVIGLGSDNNYYLLDAIRDRLGLRERADALLSLHRRWKPRVVGYEKYGKDSDIDYIKERMAEENYRFEITEVGGQMSKEDRIRRMIPIFAPVNEGEDGRFLFPESLMKTDYEGIRRDLIQSFILEEYNPFPVGLHDDLFDAISRIWDIPTIWPKPAVQEDRYARPRQRRRALSAWAA